MLYFNMSCKKRFTFLLSSGEMLSDGFSNPIFDKTSLQQITSNHDVRLSSDHKTLVALLPPHLTLVMFIVFVMFTVGKFRTCLC